MEKLSVLHLREGLLRLFFKPMLLLVLPRRLAWFFMASSHMPMLLEEPPLTPFPSMPPGPPHTPMLSFQWLPREELPIDKPECWERKSRGAGWMTVFVLVCVWGLRQHGRG